uniref:TatD related DNase n=1 Tax=Chromera velia CCMP2878 TaxID=1169474 RepID=A0A0G4I5V9_9ALVE|eukprot:Cvel_52.t1-p1 / transcript=Cvel_52.t1 / gene=Cvel_52 / organism=Chromera_velia_CCMP2878 / gene_product=Putative deoxyribonuclease tatdn3, putative / transcript_product=Putative deoxyribonuclease tatdn3, putative / location=Cvel_scaffold6:6534-7934(+) / protein_length=467 / sequence_SO=supercontig / SO=protein_coding / is_pseudo=false
MEALSDCHCHLLHFASESAHESQSVRAVLSRAHEKGVRRVVAVPEYPEEILPVSYLSESFPCVTDEFPQVSACAGLHPIQGSYDDLSRARSLTPLDVSLCLESIRKSLETGAVGVEEVGLDFTPKFLEASVLNQRLASLSPEECVSTLGVSLDLLDREAQQFLSQKKIANMEKQTSVGEGQGGSGPSNAETLTQSLTGAERAVLRARALQVLSLRKQLSLAVEFGGLPVNLHSRSAGPHVLREVLEAWERFGDAWPSSEQFTKGAAVGVSHSPSGRSMKELAGLKSGEVFLSEKRKGTQAASAGGALQPPFSAHFHAPGLSLKDALRAVSVAPDSVFFSVPPSFTKGSSLSPLFCPSEVIQREGEGEKGSGATSKRKKKKKTGPGPLPSSCLLLETDAPALGREPAEVALSLEWLQRIRGDTRERGEAESEGYSLEEKNSFTITALDLEQNAVRAYGEVRMSGEMNR